MVVVVEAVEVEEAVVVVVEAVVAELLLLLAAAATSADGGTRPIFVMCHYCKGDSSLSKIAAVEDALLQGRNVPRRNAPAKFSSGRIKQGSGKGPNQSLSLADRRHKIKGLFPPSLLHARKTI